jgi:hypothetical protein
MAVNLLAVRDVGILLSSVLLPAAALTATQSQTMR